jgi:hypothetical protein
MPGLGAGDVGPMSFGKCLDRAFAIYRRAFAPLLLSAALLMVPTALATALVALGYYKFSPGMAGLAFGDFSRWGNLMRSMGSPDELANVMMGGGSTMDTGGYSLMLLATFVLYIVQIVFYPMLWGLAGSITAQVHLGRAPDTRQAWQATKEAYWHLVAVSMVVVLSPMFTSCLFLFMLPLITCYPWVVLFERRGFGSGLNRAIQLGGSDYGRILWWYVVSYCIAGVLAQSVGTALHLAVSFGLAQLLPGTALATAASASSSYLAQTVFLPIATVFQVLIYFDLRARREAFDLRLKLGPSQAVSG